MTIEDDDRLTAWWLGLAPSRQEEVLAAPPATLAWFAESIAQADLDQATVEAFLRDQRDDVEPTRDSGINPKPES